MRVIKNERIEGQKAKIKAVDNANYPLKHTCFYCRSVLEVERKDVSTDDIPSVKCEVCGNTTCIDFSYNRKFYKRKTFELLFALIIIMCLMVLKAEGCFTKNNCNTIKQILR